MINLPKIQNIARLYVDKLILPSEPLHPLWNCENALFSKPPKWNYMDGCVINAVCMLYELNGEQNLLDYAVRFTDAYVREDGSIPTMNPLDFNLDNVNGGKNLITLFRLTGNPKYQRAFNQIYSQQILNQPRLACGSFFHKAIYPRQLWLDGSYMALPFITEFASVSGELTLLQDVLRQVENIVSIMRDENTGLYFHAYDESRSMFWADPNTGLSHEIWLRAMGWFCAALADICGLSTNYPPLRNFCADALSDALEALSQCITAENMLLQLPANPLYPGNYPETSGSLLFAYSALKACRLGICGDKIKTDGIKILSAVTENFILVGENDIPVMKNICLMAGLGGEKKRDGSAQYYLSEAVVENDAKGIAPFLMAAAELERECKA